MSELKPRNGSCLCGAVQFSVDKLSTQVGACHCGMCRQWGGGPLLAVDGGSEVAFQGEDSIALFDSSEWAERGFCKLCGSHLFYRLKHNQQTIMPVGLFDDQADFNFDHQVFVDERPEYYCFANRTHDMTGAEVFAKYAPESEDA